MAIGQLHAPVTLYTRESLGTHCTGRWVGPMPGQVRKISSLPGFDPPTVQTEASCYTLRYPAHTNGIALPLFDATSVSYLFRPLVRQSYGRWTEWNTAIL